MEGYADYTINRLWSVAYVVKPDIYLQTQTSYLNSTTGNFSRTPQFELEHYGQVQWEAMPGFLSLQAKAGFMERWEHASAAQNLDARHYTQFVYGAAAWFTVQRGLLFTLVVENSTEIGTIRGDGAQYGLPENTDYILLTNWSIM